MAKRVVDDASLTAVADAIRAKTGKTDGLTFPADFETSVEDVFAAGEKAEYNRFWDALQNFGNRTNYTSCFGGAGWTDDSFRPKYDIKVSGNANYMFSGCKIQNIKNILTERGLTLDFSKCTSAGYLLSGSVPEQEFPPFDCCSMASMTDVFRYASYITKVELTNVGATLSWGNTFLNCSNLEHLSIQGSVGKTISFAQSSKLSKSSIESVFDALSTTTTGQSVTLSLAAVNAAFETSEGAADGSTSAQWTELANTKSNWTINLV